MTHIVYIISTLQRSGPVNILFNLVKYLDKNTHRVTILTLSAEGAGSRKQDFLDLDLKVITLDARHQILSGKMISTLKKTVQELSPDIIHTNGFRADILAGFFLKGYKKVTSLQNYPYFDYAMTYGKLKGGAMAALTTLSLKRFDQPVTCSNAVAVKMKEKGLKHISVINNGIDLQYFIPPTQQEITQAKISLGVQDYKTVFCFIGTLTDRKLPQVTIEAFLKLQNKDVCLIMVGNGDLKEECERIAGNAANIRFVGKVSDTKPYLNASEFYIATSKAEGLPTSVLESLALGVPVILSDIEPHKEILAFNQTAGLLAPVYNINETYNCLRNILTKEKEEMRQAGVNIVKDHLSASKMASSYAAVYASLQTH
ncbi:glycosyltransferase [Chitinophaga sp. SYP-B3965]|uniref:glycosyltransferase family 4 protein n=1 Tax=Chitinophaga sp. SYP-B3965 TaxID=2663120 RepID=UPI0012996201|nr:glycosyltransferase family 4 protein [Chitinophaga sp. SYP-B3965]MRG46917.1 glycosyltransferase [Chitinophaga sp. SYP-B3965]